MMRRPVTLFAGMVAAILATSTVGAPEALGAIHRGRSLNPCMLLTAPQAATVLGVELVGKPFRYPGGCSWQPVPADQANLSSVNVEVRPTKNLLGKRYRNVRAYLEKTTTVGINALHGLGDEAFSTFTVLSGPGTSDGITVRIGKNVLSIAYVRDTPVANPSPQLDQIVSIVKTIVPKLRRN